MPDNPDFDVFISYKNEYFPWVEVLGRNLEQNGFSVWLDDWRRVAGDPVARSLAHALSISRNGIIVVTPEAAQSGWVQSEYETMRERQRRGDGFRCIPVILKASEGFAFLNELFAVDFRDTLTPVHYRRKLHELVCGLQGLAAGDATTLRGDVELPPALSGTGVTVSEARSSFDSILDELAQTRIAAIFTQEGTQQGPGIEPFLRRAGPRLGAEEVYHVVPPVCGDADTAAYFRHIANRCGLDDEISDATSLGLALAARFDDDRRRRLLVVSHIENGPNKARYDFAAQIRQLLEQYPSMLRVLLVGGEKLDYLVFSANEKLSIFNIAMSSSKDWPDPTVEDIVSSASPGTIDAEEAREILDATGGEPRLVTECIRRRAKMTGGPPRRYDEVVKSSVTVRQWFAPFLGDDRAVLRLSGLLDREDLGLFAAMRDDELRRKLYWRGALRKTVDTNGIDHLVWRSDEVREAGRTTLRCDQF